MPLNLRNLSSWLLARTLIALGYVRKAKLKALNGDHVLSLYFHNPSKKEFEACVRWLIEQKFIFLSIGELEHIIENRLPLPKAGVLLTVDDGWASNESNIVEVAARYEIPVTIFVSTQPVEEGAYWWSYVQRRTNAEHTQILKKLPNGERLAVVNAIKRDFMLPREAMTVQQLKRVSRASVVTIGGHTHTHPVLTTCEQAQVYHELEHSKNKLESWLNKRITYFAYPNGNYGSREMHVLKDLGYTLAFTNVPQYLTDRKLAYSYELPRIGLLEGASMAENICRMVGVWHPAVATLKRIFKGKPVQENDIASYKPASIGKADVGI